MVMDSQSKTKTLFIYMIKIAQPKYNLTYIEDKVFTTMDKSTTVHNNC